MKTFPLTVAAVNSVHFQGDVISMTCPAREGEVTILAHHVPFVSTLRPGTLRIKTESGETDLQLDHGILEVNSSGTTILV